MSLENSWKQMGEQGDKDLLKLLRPSNLSKLHSNHPLKKIKQGLLMNGCWGLIILLGYIAVLIYFPVWQVQLCVAIVTIFTAWAVYSTYQQYSELKANITAENSVLEELKRHHASIEEWMRIQQRVALFIYPISVAGGFMLGGVAGSGKSVADFMSKPTIVIALGVCILILTPLCYFLARWLFKVSFGKHMKHLKTLIADLQEDAN